MKIVDVVRGVLRDEEGKILMVKKRTSVGTPIDGEWHLPGGKVHFPDDLSREMALYREFLEETGRSVDVGEVIGVFPNVEDDTAFFGVYYQVALHRTDPNWRKPEEIADIGWFTIFSARLHMGKVSQSFLPADFWGKIR